MIHESFNESMLLIKWHCLGNFRFAYPPDLVQDTKIGPKNSMHTPCTHTHTNNTWNIVVFSSLSPHGLSAQECWQTQGWRQRWRDYPQLLSAGLWPLGTSHGSHLKNPRLRPEKHSREITSAKILQSSHINKALLMVIRLEMVRQAHGLHASAHNSINSQLLLYQVTFW